MLEGFTQPEKNLGGLAPPKGGACERADIQEQKQVKSDYEDDDEEEAWTAYTGRRACCFPRRDRDGS